MSTVAPPPTPYRVEYSESVRQRLLVLADSARQRGDGEEFMTALKEFDRRLRVYPQFGDPIVDLKKEPGQVWIGIVRPLAMRYGVFDERRLVIVSAIPVLLRKSEPEKSE
jgi:hypothetical protein